MNSRQLGKFNIPNELIRNNPDIVAAAFRDMGVVIVRAELFYHSLMMEYFGISHMFTECQVGCEGPEYKVDIIVNQAEDEEPEYSHVEVTKYD